MVTSFWMIFLRIQNKIILFLSVTEGTNVVDNSIPDDVWGSEHELTGVLSDKI